jgi:hypothetical protein
MILISDNGFPRRGRVDLATAPEKAIRAAMAAVEAMPADERLSQAGQLLQRALDAVAEFEDERLAAAGCVSWDVYQRTNKVLDEALARIVQLEGAMIVANMTVPPAPEAKP